MSSKQVHEGQIVHYGAGESNGGVQFIRATVRTDHDRDVNVIIERGQIERWLKLLSDLPFNPL